MPTRPDRAADGGHAGEQRARTAIRRRQRCHHCLRQNRRYEGRNREGRFILRPPWSSKLP